MLKVLKGNSRLLNNVTREIELWLPNTFLGFNRTLTSVAARSICRYLSSEGGADRDLLRNFRVFHGGKELDKLKVIKGGEHHTEDEELVSNLIYYLNNCMCRETFICSDKTFSVNSLLRIRSKLLKCSISLRCIERFDGHAEVYDVLKEGVL